MARIEYICNLSDVVSNYSITDAASVVTELVYNALDANATTLSVRVNLEKYFIQVTDNGHGVDKKNLLNMGKSHYTSKCSSLEQLEGIIPTYGYRGLSLAHIADVAERLEIRSRVKGCSSPLQKVFTKGVEGNVDKVTPASACRRIGTRVTVIGLFYKYAVKRLRGRATCVLENMRRELQALGVFHKKVSISLINDENGTVLFQSQNSLLPEFSNESVINIEASANNTQIVGYICKHLHSDSGLQYVFLNKRPVFRSKIHELVVQLIAKSQIFWDKSRDESAGAIDIDGFIFFIHIQCSYLAVNIERDPARNSMRISFSEKSDHYKLLCKAVKNALADNCEENSAHLSHVNAELRDETHKEFGPSQMRTAVLGGTVSRQHEFDSAANKKRVASPELNTPAIATATHSHENAVMGPPEKRPKTRPDLIAVDKNASRIGVDAPEEYLRELDEEGTEHPGNAPILEPANFPQIGFHDFYAWFRASAAKGGEAEKLINEYMNFKSQQMAVNRRPLGVPCEDDMDSRMMGQRNGSLLDKRRQKFVRVNKAVSKKIEQCYDGKLRRMREKESCVSVSSQSNDSPPSFATWESHYRNDNKGGEFPASRVPEKDSIGPSMGCQSYADVAIRNENSPGDVTPSADSSQVLSVRTSKEGTDTCCRIVPDFISIGTQTELNVKESCSQVVINTQSIGLQTSPLPFTMVAQVQIDPNLGPNLEDSFTRSSTYQKFLFSAGIATNVHPQDNILATFGNCNIFDPDAELSPTKKYPIWEDVKKIEILSQPMILPVSTIELRSCENPVNMQMGEIDNSRFQNLAPCEAQSLPADQCSPAVNPASAGQEVATSVDLPGATAMQGFKHSNFSKSSSVGAEDGISETAATYDHATRLHPYPGTATAFNSCENPVNVQLGEIGISRPRNLGLRDTQSLGAEQCSRSTLESNPTQDVEMSAVLTPSQLFQQSACAPEIACGIPRQSSILVDIPREETDTMEVTGEDEELPCGQLSSGCTVDLASKQSTDVLQEATSSAAHNIVNFTENDNKEEEKDDDDDESVLKDYDDGDDDGNHAKVKVDNKKKNLDANKPIPPVIDLTSDDEFDLGLPNCGTSKSAECEQGVLQKSHVGDESPVKTPGTFTEQDVPKMHQTGGTADVLGKEISEDSGTNLGDESPVKTPETFTEQNVPKMHQTGGTADVDSSDNGLPSTREIKGQQTSQVQPVLETQVVPAKSQGGGTGIVGDNENEPTILRSLDEILGLLTSQMLPIIRVDTATPGQESPEGTGTPRPFRRADNDELFYVRVADVHSSFNPPCTSSRISYEVQGKTAGVPELIIDKIANSGLTSLSTACESCMVQASDEATVSRILAELEGRSSNTDLPNAAISKLDSHIGSILSPATVSKDELANVQVIGQLNNQFIVALITAADGTETVSLFDQHAVDERIKVEALLKRYKVNNRFVSEPLARPFQLIVKGEVVEMIIKNHYHIFTYCGLHLELRGMKTVLVRAVPACFARRHEREVDVSREISLARLVERLITEITTYIQIVPSGVGFEMPDIINKVICVEACHSAIKFGKPLSTEVMIELVKTLKKCFNPFMCAHGRPSLLTLCQLPR